MHIAKLLMGYKVPADEEPKAVEKERTNLNKGEVVNEVLALLEAEIARQVTTPEIGLATKFALIFDDRVSVPEYKNCLSIDPDRPDRMEGR